MSQVREYIMRKALRRRLAWECEVVREWADGVRLCDLGREVRRTQEGLTTVGEDQRRSGERGRYWEGRSIKRQRLRGGGEEKRKEGD